MAPKKFVPFARIALTCCAFLWALNPCMPVSTQTDNVPHEIDSLRDPGLCNIIVRSNRA